MLRIFFDLIRDYGTFGAVLASICLNGYLFYKLFTNHLAHLSQDVSNVKDTVDEVQKELGETNQRVSKIEGMLE